MKGSRRWALRTLTLCLCLMGCTGRVGPQQEAAEDPEQALSHLLEDLQAGDYEMALTYMEEGNPLIYVLSGEPAVPELEEVYQAFRERLGGFTFRLEPGSRYSDSIIHVTAEQLDFSGAIREAMLQALEDQCLEGGSAFSDYAVWMGQGIAAAEPGEEGTAHAVASLSRKTYTVEHMGSGDQDFLNLITGGFYDYADFQMARCTKSQEGAEFTCLFAALGDRVIACLEEASQPLEAELSPEEEELLEEFYTQVFQTLDEGNRGICVRTWARGGRAGVSTGIDFVAADQNALISAGLVSGKYQGNTTTRYLSLRSTLRDMENDGWTCIVEPVYNQEEG